LKKAWLANNYSGMKSVAENMTELMRDPVKLGGIENDR